MKKTVKFGTDGIRGNSENFPFTNKALIALGQSIAKWAISKYKKTNPKILIGHDTRVSCKKIKEQLEKGLLTLGLNIFDAQVLPTPAICKLTNYYKEFDLGIIISASHNPYYDNGIKLVDAKTGKLKPEDEKIIENNFKKQLKKIENLEEQTGPSHKVSPHAKSTKNKSANKIERMEIFNTLGQINLWPQANSEYIRIIISLFQKNFLRGKKIVLDCANGSTYKVAPTIFEKLGAQVITINNTPDGTNINKSCGALHTENLEQQILKNKADIGFAFDGDGDRVIAVNKNGQTIDGDQIIALLSEHPKAIKHKTVVGTVMTNLGLDSHLKGKNINLIRTKVGDKYVSAKLIENDLFLGGESSGHIIMTDYLNTGDGIFTALRVVQTAILTNSWTLKLFNKTPQVLINVSISQKKDLTIQPCSKIIENHKTLLKSGRIVVRYSGTENLLRIMTEGKEEKLTMDVAHSLAKNLKEALK